MNRLIRLAARMYPRAWRERYGEEFEALLDDAGADGRAASNVLVGAVLMHFQRRKKMGAAALLAIGAILTASWWIGQRPYITLGSHQVFRMDSNPWGAMAGFLVFLAAIIVGLPILVLCVNDRGCRGEAARTGKICASIAALYLAALVLVSLLTPRTIVSIGDGYCWDLWCLGVEQVHAVPQGQNILYTAEVRIFSTANRVATYREKDFLYVLDDLDRRFPVFQDSSTLPALDLNVKPKESVKTTLSFVAPANARKLYLTGDHRAMPWVYFYFGSDINPFHRRTLLRVL
jgi:hypothetical protein